MQDDLSNDRVAPRVAIRHNRIMELLESGITDVQAQARLLEVSAATVRRDLSVLERKNKIIRRYGGAVHLDPQDEESINERQSIHRPEKYIIARYVAETISDESVIFMDAGTTVATVAQLLRDRKVSVVTSGLSTVEALRNSTTVKVRVLGGNLRHISWSIVGSAAVHELNFMTADIALVSGDGLDPKWGICERSEEQIAVKNAMITRAKKIFVLADSSKLSSATHSHSWARLDREWTLVTDSGVSQEQLFAYKAALGCKVVVVNDLAEPAR